MADTNILQSINIGGKRFSVPACWEELGLTKAYMLALLSRDEYTPTVDHKPTETDTIYTDPDSGNPAGFHEGQCVIYPDEEMPAGWGLSIAMNVTVNEQGVPTNIVWLHLSDMGKALIAHSAQLNVISGNIYKLQATADAATPRQIDIGELDTMGTDGSAAEISTFVRNLAKTGPTHTRWAVTSGGSLYLVGTLDVMSDSARHVLTQVFETHHTFTNGVLNTNEHTDGAIRRYSRSFNIDAASDFSVAIGKWTPWQECEPESVEELRTQLNSLKASHNTLAPFVSKNQVDIAKLTPTVEALESGGVYVAYWPSLTTEQYCAVPLEEWLEIKKENDEAVALGILVMPDMGEPFIVSLTEGKTKWHSSVSSVLYADGASTELTKHFNNTINVKERHIALYGNSCVLATYCLDHHYTINGAGYGPIQWYAPDLKMMMAMRKYFSQINKCLSAIDGAELLCSNGATYWTANEVSASKAVSINMSTSRIISGSKVVSACIRPVGFLAF